MREHNELYIDGAWRVPLQPSVLELNDPATGVPTGRVTLGGEADVDAAVTAAERAFVAYSQTTPQERIALLERVLTEFDNRAEDLARAVTEELGAPLSLVRGAHLPSGRVQIATAIEILKTFEFTETRGKTRIRKEALGVAGLITPWNFPVLQTAGKTVSALAAGCTVVLKPAQLTPYSAVILAEIMHAAGVPAGVFNLVNGRGSVVGSTLSTHPGVGTVSFTGSLAAATQIAIANDTPYGLAAYVTSGDLEAANAVAERIRAGYVLINDTEFDWTAPWGGYKQSGNGREFGTAGLAEYLETKVIRG